MNKVLHKSSVFLQRNGSTILTGLGAIGVAVTAIAAVKATPKATNRLEAAKEEKGEELTKIEKVKIAGPAYIPAILIGTSTVACIFGANVLNKRHQAALASAYALLDSSYKEYKEKTAELYGEEAHTRINEEIAKDHYDENELDLDFEDGKKLFYDIFSKRYFRSTPETVIKAEYEVNRKLQNEGGVYLNEFYEFLDIPPIPAGQELGWSTGTLEGAWAYWIEFDHSETVMEDGIECTIIEMRYEPMIDFAYY